MKPPKTSPAPKKIGAARDTGKTPMNGARFGSARSLQVVKEASVRQSDALARLAKR